MSAVIGVSLKTYFSHARATAWFREVREVAVAHEAVASGTVELFIAPTFLQIPAALTVFAETPVVVAAQDVAASVPGAHTGDVTAAELAEIGVRIVEIGHAERRRDHDESDAVVAAKTRMTIEHGLVPLICVGEQTETSAAQAAEVCAAQLQAALAEAPPGRVLVAYEPVWAIGAAEPAAVGHISAVCVVLQKLLRKTGELRSGSAVMYGGSAGAGLLDRLGAAVDGLFLGRFAHDPETLSVILDEAARRSRE